MSEPLSVSLNRGRIHDVEAPDRFTADGPFAIELTNEGEAVHVHLHLDDELSRVARLDAGNHYVEGGSTVAVGVEVGIVDEPITGMLKVTTGYGAETTYVRITIEPGAPSKRPIEIDESLSKPSKRDEPTSGFGNNTRSNADDDGNVAALVGLGIILLLVVALAVGFVVNSPILFLGIGIVVGAVLVGLFLLYR